MRTKPLVLLVVMTERAEPTPLLLLGLRLVLLLALPALSHVVPSRLTV